MVVASKLSPEEAQRRVNDMITAARLADAAGEVPKKKPVPPVRPAKQVFSVQYSFFRKTAYKVSDDVDFRQDSGFSSFKKRFRLTPR